MPSYARKLLVPEGVDCVVHTISRCVRRAMLCGFDVRDGCSYEHRRDWVQQRIRHLASLFAIEVCAFAVMSNHCHLVLWCRPSVAADWTELEVARRWLTLFGRSHRTPTDEECLQAASHPGKIEQWRGRLGSVSWFMRCLNEWIARRANAEDQCSGRFWEGRFKCQLLEDDGAVLACMAYVDLNPVRAKLAESLESSVFTAIHARLMAMQARAGLGGGEAGKEEDRCCPDVPSREETPPGTMEGSADKVSADATVDAWLCPMGDRAARPTILSISAKDYITLVDWTGRQLADGKRGVLNPEMAPLLERLELATGHWLEMVGEFGGLFRRVVGKPSSMVMKARQMNQHWLAGMRSSRLVFNCR